MYYTLFRVVNIGKIVWMSCKEKQSNHKNHYIPNSSLETGKSILNSGCVINSRKGMDIGL